MGGIVIAMDNVLTREEILYWGKNIEELWSEPYPEQYFYPNTNKGYSGYAYEMEDETIMYYGMFLDGLRDGAFVYFDEEGNVSSREHYEKGKLEGYYAYYSEEGNVLEDGVYHLGYRVFYNKYDKNGNLVVHVPNSYKRTSNFTFSDIIQDKVKEIVEQKQQGLQEEQKRLVQFLELENRISMDKIHTVAGVDLAYWKEKNEEYAVCSIVVIDFKTHKIIEKVSYKGKVDFPYIPGYLAFREMPLFMKTEKMLESNPDVYFFDGNGYLHPRHMGIATHAGIVLNKPTIGIAKSYYKIAETEYEMPENKECAFSDIVIEDEVYGRVLRTHKDVKPVFVSVGNMIDLNTATELTMRLVDKESHIPIPTRLADIETHIERHLHE